MELPANSRPSTPTAPTSTLRDRVFHCTAIGRGRAHRRDRHDGDRARHHVDEMRASPGVTTIISVNSPRLFDEAMADGLIAMAEHGQPVTVTPFTLMGAMTPVTLAAALAPAECRSAVRGGADPARESRRAGDVRRLHLQRRHASGAPAFGTPENAKANIVPASSRAVTVCPTARRTPMPPTWSTCRPPTRPKWPPGARCSAAPT